MTSKKLADLTVRDGVKLYFAYRATRYATAIAGGVVWGVFKKSGGKEKVETWVADLERWSKNQQAKTSWQRNQRLQREAYLKRVAEEKAEEGSDVG
jgi:hypothetical protein